MKTKIILLAALMLSIGLVGMTYSYSTANAAPPQRFGFDTGLVTLGPNELLRLTAVSVTGETPAVAFKRTNYTQDL